VEPKPNPPDPLIADYEAAVARGREHPLFQWFEERRGRVSLSERTFASIFSSRLMIGIGGGVLIVLIYWLIIHFTGRRSIWSTGYMFLLGLAGPLAALIHHKFGGKTLIPKPSPTSRMPLSVSEVICDPHRHQQALADLAMTCRGSEIAHILIAEADTSSLRRFLFIIVIALGAIMAMIGYVGYLIAESEMIGILTGLAVGIVMVGLAIPELLNRKIVHIRDSMEAPAGDFLGPSPVRHFHELSDDELAALHPKGRLIVAFFDIKALFFLLLVVSLAAYCFHDIFLYILVIPACVAFLAWRIIAARIIRRLTPLINESAIADYLADADAKFNEWYEQLGEEEEE